MGLVWTECIRQANEMLDSWKGCSDIRQTGKDVRRFSLHVLTSTGFGKSYHFDRSTDENVREGDPMTYKDSLSLILENCILIMLLGPKLLTGSLQRFLPKHWRLVGQATSTFKRHIAESIKEENELMADGKINRGNFISAMVRASEEEARKLDASTGRPLHGLTETEIYGNIFVFNFAGHDSIAITLTYVITHLAAHPEIQDWLAAEIYHVFKVQGATAYRDAFPKLKRCTAVVVSLP
jgi:cytochrome P450